MYRHYSRIRQYSTESNERLQSCIALYDYEQNVMVINNIKLNISSNFVILINYHFGFVSLANFDFKLKILNMVFLNSNFELKIAKLQYQSHLLYKTYFPNML
jgi:hypothetical protein